MKSQSALTLLACLVLSSLPARAAPNAPTPAPESEPQAQLIPKNEGFQFQQIQAGSVWEKLGLKNGDTILSINGKKPIASAEGIQEALEQLSTQEHLKLKVLRGKKTIDLNYNIK